MKQLLGKKKTAKLEALLGFPIRYAYTRGGWAHGTAEVILRPTVSTEPGSGACVIFAHRHTGEYVADICDGRSVESFVDCGCPCPARDRKKED
jgi:hypothetical protein